jgi:hypothetical protein
LASGSSPAGTEVFVAEALSHVQDPDAPTPDEKFGLGIEGDEAIHAVLDLMVAGAPFDTMTRAVHIHPTVAELLPTAFAEMEPAG